MNKYKVRVYVTSYIDVNVNADTEQDAIEIATKNSDLWFKDNSILNNVELWEGESEIIND